MTNFPSEKELKKIRKLLSKGIASRPLPPNATPVDKIKYKICQKFIIYKNSSPMTQKEMAKKLGIDESLMSKILHCHYDEFTIDRLLKFLGILFSSIDIKIDVA
jgi:predicted XRE-type DNA-binding protein